MISNHQGYSNYQQNNHVNQCNSLQQADSQTFGDQNYNNSQGNATLTAILPLLLQLILTLVQQLQGNNPESDQSDNTDQDTGGNGLFNTQPDTDVTNFNDTPGGDPLPQDLPPLSGLDETLEEAVASNDDSFTVDMDNDGVVSSGDFIIDPTTNTAQEIGAIDPEVLGVAELDALMQEQQSRTENLTDVERAALEAQGNDSLFDVISTAPEGVTDVASDLPTAIDLDRNGRFSDGDILLDRYVDTAMRVNHVQEEPVITDLAGLQTEMDTQAATLTNLSDDERVTLTEESNTNTFEILGAESFGTPSQSDVIGLPELEELMAAQAEAESRWTD